MSDADADAPPALDGWMRQLAPLASQHHASEYSRMKYGHRGCPVSYTPLPVHVVRALRDRQQKYADQVLWWPCPSAAPRRAAHTMPPPELQHRRDTIKTSESHPINISQIIPPESLVAISSHLTPCEKPSPVLFEIHFPYSLDRIAGHPQLPAASPSIAQHKYLPSNERRSSVTGVLNAALNTKLSLPPLPTPSSRVLLSLKRNLKIHTISDRTSESDAPDATAPRHATSSPTQAPSSRLPALPTTYALHPLSPHTRPPTAPSPPNKISRSRASKSSATAPLRQDTTSQRPFKLGNLLLSSCPGKKVRLSGPVRGRSAVCRDLDVDLRRMKMLGARCVVCCLDDEELELLIGASWIEYCQVAHREGLDVLRIPLPEGLTPLSPKSLDADLDRIIEGYSLRGISVLVHCRGGVGRAGLFACCWMLKLGLCGWIETEIPPSAATTTGMADSEMKRDDAPSRTFRWDSETVVRRDTLQLVERIIEVVRRRRSVKAIETLEQVQFLVEYVDYLRTCECIDGDSTQLACRPNIL